MKTMREWTRSGLGFREFANPGDEIDSEMYNYFLGCVHPIYFHGGFMCGEPSYHPIGEAVYNTFYFFNEKYRYVGQFTEIESIIIGRFMRNLC